MSRVWVTLEESKRLGPSLAKLSRKGDKTVSGCRARGPVEAWRAAAHQTWRSHVPKPRCSRAPGHTGPHRVYNRKAEILAEWSA